jgi:hypothetical protein
MVEIGSWTRDLCLEDPIRERSQNMYTLRRGQRFVTFPCKNMGICTVLRYEGGGGSKISKNCLRILWTLPKYSITPRSALHMKIVKFCVDRITLYDENNFIDSLAFWLGWPDLCSEKRGNNLFFLKNSMKKEDFKSRLKKMFLIICNFANWRIIIQ